MRSLSVALAVGTAGHRCCPSALSFNAPSLPAVAAALCVVGSRSEPLQFALAGLYPPAAVLLVALMAPWARSLSVALAVGTAAHRCCSSALLFNAPSLAAAAAALCIIYSRSKPLQFALAGLYPPAAALLVALMAP